MIANTIGIGVNQAIIPTSSTAPIAASRYSAFTKRRVGLMENIVASSPASLCPIGAPTAGATYAGGRDTTRVSTSVPSNAWPHVRQNEAVSLFSAPQRSQNIGVIMLGVPTKHKKRDRVTHTAACLATSWRRVFYSRGESPLKNGGTGPVGGSADHKIIDLRVSSFHPQGEWRRRLAHRPSADGSHASRAVRPGSRLRGGNSSQSSRRRSRRTWP